MFHFRLVTYNGIHNLCFQYNALLCDIITKQHPQYFRAQMVMFALIIEFGADAFVAFKPHGYVLRKKSHSCIRCHLSHHLSPLEACHFCNTAFRVIFFSMLFLLSPVYGLLFASFSAKTPPPKVCQPFRLDIYGASTCLWIAPTRKELCSIACCDHDVIHYFLYTHDSNKLVRCVWEEEEEYVSVFDKAIVLREVRDWYEMNGKKSLRIVDDMPDVDSLAWSLSRVIDDI